MFCSVIPYSCKILVMLILAFSGSAIILKNASKTFALGDVCISELPVYLTGIPCEARICATLRPSFCFLDNMAKSLYLYLGFDFLSSFILFVIYSACEYSVVQLITFTLKSWVLTGVIFLGFLKVSCSSNCPERFITLGGFR